MVASIEFQVSSASGMTAPRILDGRREPRELTGQGVPSRGRRTAPLT